MNPTETLKVTTPLAAQIVMTRTFDAPRQLVFDAFTKPELPGRDGDHDDLRRAEWAAPR